MPKYDIVFIVSELVSGENMVRKWRNCDALQRVDAWFTAFWFQKNGENVCGCGGCVVQCGGCHVEIGKIILYFQ